MAVGQVERIPVGDLQVEVETWGDGEPTLVLVHGLTGSRDDWREVGPRLAPPGRCLAPDLRGHGGTDNPGTPDGYHFDQLVADLHGLLERLAPGGPCDLLGHSLGGMVALRFALAHPERLRSLVLMDTAPAGLAGAAARGFLEAGARVAREVGMGALFQGTRARAAVDPTRPAASRALEQRMGPERYWARVRAKYEAMDPEAFACLAPLIAHHESLVGRLGEIRVPTLVLVGEEDRPFREPSERMAAAIPGAQQVVIPEASHSPQLENPEAWLRAVQEHLARARGEAAQSSCASFVAS